MIHEDVEPMLLLGAGRAEQSVAENGNRRRWVLFQSGLPSQTSGR